MSASKIESCDFSIMIPEDELGHIRSNDEFYIIKCPSCVTELSYHKEKLYIKKDKSFGWCHRCHTLFLDRYTKFTYPELQLIIPNFGNYNLEEFYINISMYNDARTCPNEIDLDYLVNTRKNPFILETLLSPKVAVRFTNDGLIIPYHNRAKDINYYAIRFYKPRGDLKYFLPPIKKKPYYIIRADNNNGNYIIVEGQLDAIAVHAMYPQFHVIALSGSTMTSYHISQLKNEDDLPNDILVWLDDDFLNKQLLKKIKKEFPYCNYKACTTGDMDPEEYYKYYYHGDKDK